MTSKYFTRINTLGEVNKSVAMLNSIADDLFPKVADGQETFEYKSPDGDVVFSGILKDRRYYGGYHVSSYICRFHREVFAEEVL